MTVFGYSRIFGIKFGCLLFFFFFFNKNLELVIVINIEDVFNWDLNFKGLCKKLVVFIN